MKGVTIKNYLLAGLVVWLPIIATLFILRFIVDLLDKTIALLPTAYQPENLFGMNLPGLGVFLSLALLLITGIIATNFMGQKLVKISESVLDRIPLVRTIYSASKQMIEALVSNKSKAFRKVLLVEYPRKGLWSVAFQTGELSSELNQYTAEDMVSIFIPTTPNPTSGFLMMVPRKDIIELKMSTDEALKFIISLGVMDPHSQANIKKR